MVLHAKARQLARSGRVRTRRSILPVPRPPIPDKVENTMTVDGDAARGPARGFVTSGLAT